MNDKNIGEAVEEIRKEVASDLMKIDKSYSMNVIFIIIIIMINLIFVLAILLIIF